MKKSYLKGLFILTVFLLLVIFSNRSYNNIQEPIFIISIIMVSLAIGIIGVYLFGKDMKVYKNLYFVSFLITVGMVFVSGGGVFVEENHRSYGFPAQFFTHYELSGYVSLNIGGFLLNFLIVYIILRALSKMVIKSTFNQ
ncbi:hypothetical protein HXA34_03870 [Salipaludibacillus agaradhaerens]|uniref:efflux RND transporter permease subunit n=1 Tax=Salipaludibacillus agaradhaerens TaxID=76935 RepID=UPI0021509387|nr:efflux RND transporter permease subunit [Salipaludibacillus agaradhaerens]MCR6105418.1 hypothetical protein [Salipaludibacillus agaradhaerens]MCR6117457.1 hypothetical protein [Salipaludibacillus agaradhaerens]